MSCPTECFDRTLLRHWWARTAPLSLCWTREPKSCLPESLTRVRTMRRGYSRKSGQGHACMPCVESCTWSSSSHEVEEVAHGGCPPHVCFLGGHFEDNCGNWDDDDVTDIIDKVIAIIKTNSNYPLSNSCLLPVTAKKKKERKKGKKNKLESIVADLMIMISINLLLSLKGALSVQEKRNWRHTYTHKGREFPS